MKKTLIIIFSLFLLSSCSESQENKVIEYCMDTLNIYSNVSKDQCLCFYNEASNKFSSTEIDRMVKSSPIKQESTLTREGTMFLTIAHSSKCFE
ncbi:MULTISPECIES: lipoprotein [Proteus]|uniref:lipoprotein n=1 Tax=Proteus TaxID=583 RepID=UPI001377FA11|nr:MULTISPECIES: lipoprotein [Proteus]NBM50816.1 lipoprotein [Proteus sp. G2666]NBM67472.1 lipoprotein [Proteus sp. G2663]NBN03210.1 lipoprotein [Proteus sp. G2665]